MLQSVIGKQQIAIRVRRKQRASRGASVAADKDRAAAALRQQQWFIADYYRIAAGINLGDVAGRTAIAATEDSGVTPRTAQGLRQMDHQRRLAGTADAQVADDNHRYRQAFATQDARLV